MVLALTRGVRPAHQGVQQAVEAYCAWLETMSQVPGVADAPWER